MKENTVPDIIKIVDEATTPILFLVVTDSCNEFKPKIQEDLESQILLNNRPVALYTVCMPEDSLTFPRPVAPYLYYYLPKNQTPIFWRGLDMIQNLVKDIEVAEKMMEGQTQENVRYSEEERKRIAETEQSFKSEEEKEFPPLLQQARNFAKDIWKSARRGMSNLPVILTAEEGGKRLSICQECSSFDESSSRCRECGCNMSFKTQLAASSCPLKKW